MIGVIRRGERRLLRLAENAPSTEAGVYEAVFLYFTLTVLAFLEGTVLKEGADALWERFHARLPAAQRTKLAHLRKKFWAVPHAVKDYRDYDDTLAGAGDNRAGAVGAEPDAVRGGVEAGGVAEGDRGAAGGRSGAV